MGWYKDMAEIDWSDEEIALLKKYDEHIGTHRRLVRMTTQSLPAKKRQQYTQRIANSLLDMKDLEDQVKAIFKAKKLIGEKNES